MKWTKKNMTWGGYLKFAAICSAIGIAISAIVTFISWCSAFGLPDWCKKTYAAVVKPFRWVKSKFES